jgi:lysophospholipase L1-like esterase
MRARLRPVLNVLLILILVFLLVEFTSFAALSIFKKIQGDDDFHTGSPDDPRKHLDVYAQVDWAEAYFDEFAASYRTVYYPYTGYRRQPDFNGKYINLDAEGLRRTVPDCSDGSPDALQVFVMGGSAAWGTGARDEATIPSFLARKLCESGIPARVTNFGESGYTSSQELIRLILELRKGHIPDIVLFYDGVNDVFSSYQNRMAGLPQNVANRMIKYKLSKQSGVIQNLVSIALLTNTGQVAKKIVSPLIGGDRNTVASPDETYWETLDDETLDILQENMRIVRGLEREYGFTTFFYWQPAIYTKDVLSKDEEDNVKKDLAYGKRYNRVTELVKAEGSIRDLSDMLDEYDNSFFIDEYHISENGNEIIASALFQDVKRYLETRPDLAPIEH